MNASLLLRHAFTRLTVLTLTLLTLWLPFAQPNQVARAESLSSPRAILSQATFGESSAAAPASMVFSGNDSHDFSRLYLAWTSTESTRRINLMSSSDGNTFTGKVTLAESSADAPALTVFNNQLYLAWAGVDTKKRLNLLLLNGQTFSNKQILPESSSTGPALESFNNQLSIAWSGTDVYRQLSSTLFVDPASQPIVDQTRAALASTLGVRVDVIRLVTLDRVFWPDPSLGCPVPGNFYPQVIVAGYAVILEGLNRLYQYHAADSAGSVIRCDNQ